VRGSTVFRGQQNNMDSALMERGEEGTDVMSVGPEGL